MVLTSLPCWLTFEDGPGTMAKASMHSFAEGFSCLQNLPVNVQPFRYHVCNARSIDAGAQDLRCSCHMRISGWMSLQDQQSFEVLR